MFISKINGRKPDQVQALVVRAAGTNCDQETIHALTQAGAACELAHVNQILSGRTRLHPYQIVVFPGGFSYGDDIAAGKVLANELRLRLKDQLARFVEGKKLVIGVCNGFQVLVKAGLLPGFTPIDAEQSATLTLNDSGRFQCEWVAIATEKSAASWLDGMPPSFELPIAHGEGKFLTASPAVLTKLKKNRQIVFRYDKNNPNGSEAAIAGVCNVGGNVVGLMPHPERFVSRYQHPNWPLWSSASGEFGDGFWFWEKAVGYARNLLKGTVPAK
ncbi:MAG: phosphoribosylformylglycinamidine synthase I [Elusimicrobia bacterium]|nr:phosphoribosylformylglycinamidine synthase I [Elusimicrobiota bacterium]